MVCQAVEKQRRVLLPVERQLWTDITYVYYYILVGEINDLHKQNTSYDMKYQTENKSECLLSTTQTSSMYVEQVSHLIQWGEHNQEWTFFL